MIRPRIYDLEVGGGQEAKVGDRVAIHFDVKVGGRWRPRSARLRLLSSDFIHSSASFAFLRVARLEPKPIAALRALAGAVHRVQQWL